MGGGLGVVVVLRCNGWYGLGVVVALGSDGLWFRCWGCNRGCGLGVAVV